MKRSHLEEEARCNLFEMGLRHPHPRVRRRAQALVRLAQGITHTHTAAESEVHLHSMRAWMRQWPVSGLGGLHEERHEGRLRKLSPVMAQKLQQVVREEGGTIGHIMDCMEEIHMPLLVQPESVARWLKEMGFCYKRYRASLKKRDPELVAAFTQQLDALTQHAGWPTK
jgi:transposase